MAVRYVSFALDEGAKRPFKKHDGDAGWDLFVNQDVDILPGETIDVHTGVHLSMPPHLYARITGRSSSLRCHHLLVNEGIIDNGYTGELFVCIHNLGSEVFHAKRGMRLAQVIFGLIEDIRWGEVDAIAPVPGQRNNNGFGSTGK